MKCPNCNETDHPNDAKFCHICGYKFGDEVLNTNIIPVFIAPVTLHRRWFLIDSEGNTVKKLPYCTLDGDTVNSFHEGYAMIRHQAKYGYIDKEGNIIVPTIYNSGSDFSEQRAAVYNGSLWGYLNTFGEVVVPFEYNHVRAFSEGLAAVEKNDKWGYIDGAGRTVIPFIFEDALSFSEGLAPVCFEDGYGYIDKTGRIAIPARNEGIGIGRFLQKLIRPISGKPTLLNTAGEPVTRLPFRNAWHFCEGIAAVIIDEEDKSCRYKFMNRRGDFIQSIYCDNSFGYAGDFSEGIVAVSPSKYVHRYEILKKIEDLGYIDITGKNIHGFHLNTAYPFKEGMARVGFTEDGVEHTGFIDKNGTLVIDYKENEFGVFYNFSCGLTPVWKREGYGLSYGYINKSGNVVIPFKLDNAFEFGK